MIYNDIIRNEREVHELSKIGLKLNDMGKLVYQNPNLSPMMKEFLAGGLAQLSGTMANMMRRVEGFEFVDPWVKKENDGE